MIKHPTKNKGDLGVLKVKCDVTEKGYLVLNPETEHAPFDIVIYRDGKFNRVQVKYRKIIKGGIEVKFVSNWADKKGNHRKFIDKSEVDIIAIYCPDNDTCYYLDPKKFGKSVKLRIDQTKNKQKDLVNIASKFKNIPST